MKNFITSMGPYLRTENSTRKMMNRVFFALIPIILFAFVKNGLLPFISGRATFYGMMFPLMFIFIPAITSFVTELLYAIIFLGHRKKEIVKYMLSSFSILPGLFLGLVLPINTPITILIVGAIFATVIGKLVFGGFGNNVFNPALVGVLFVTISYGAIIASNGGYLNAYEVDTVTGSTPLSNVVEGIGTYDTLVKPVGGFFNLFIGLIPGAMGEISSMIIILAFIYLTVTKTIKWRIPVFYVGTVFIMTMIIGLFNGVGLWYPLFQILSGGLLFGSVFMATDPVTSPTTRTGQVIYGICLGLLTVIFRYLTPYPEGVMTSILTMNLFVYMIDKLGSKIRLNFKKAILPLTVLVIVALGFSVGISATFKETEEEDTNFNIVSKEIDGKVTKYVVTQKGFSSLLKLEIIFIDGKITEAHVIDGNDSYFEKILDAKYIEKLVSNESNIEGVDTVSGVTVSSTALKNLFINTIKDYKDNKEEVSPPKEEEKETMTKKVNGDNTTYTITEKSFGGYLTLRVTYTEKRLSSIQIMTADDTFINQVKESDLINDLVLFQDEIDIVDTVSGATVTSTAIKNAVIKTYEDMVTNNE